MQLADAFPRGGAGDAAGMRGFAGRIGAVGDPSRVGGCPGAWSRGFRFEAKRRLRDPAGQAQPLEPLHRLGGGLR